MISSLRTAGHYVRVSHAAIGRHFFSLWILAIFAAGFEGVGILLFIPILMRLVSQESAEAPGRLAGAVSSWAEGHTIGGLLAMLVVLFALKGALVYAIYVYRARVFNRARESMRLEIFDALDRVRIREVESHRIGTLGNLLVHEIDAAAYAMDRVCAGVGSATTAGVLFLLAVVLNPALSAVLVLSASLTLFLVRLFTRASMKISREATAQAGEMASLAVETLQAFKYLRATGRFAALKGAFASVTAGQRSIEDRAAVVRNLRFAVREPLLVLWIGVVFYLFVVVLRQSIGVISDGILFFYRTSIELSIFHDHWQEFSTRAGSIDAYAKLRDELIEAAEPVSSGADLRFEGEIRFEDVGFAYRDLAVLDGLDLVIPKRSTVALVGASGAGKSTAVDLVAACLEPTQGAIRIDGVDLRDLDRAQYHASLGYVTQESVLFSGSVLRNVTMCWDGTLGDDALARAREAARLANCLGFIEELEDGWDTEIGERGLRLSGGERQRVALARELYSEPHLLILDEATSALDSIAERAVQESLERLHGRLTLLIVAHRLSTIRHADLVYVLHDGRVAERGTFEDLSQRPSGRFRELCEMQSLV